MFISFFPMYFYYCLLPSTELKKEEENCLDLKSTHFVIYALIISLSCISATKLLTHLPF